MKNITNLHDGASGIGPRRLRGAAMACLSLALVLALSATAWAQFAIETKLTASDGSQSDDFGWSVGISGSTAIVGAMRNRVDDFTSGSAYLFDAISGKELLRLVPSGAGVSSEFGFSVGISGNTAIVGASFADNGSGRGGAAYLFDVVTGNQLFKLTDPEARSGNSFGRSVGISGNTAIVGMIGDDDPPSIPVGAAYLFDVITGKELLRLASIIEEGDQFGWSVAISGNTAIVGSRNDSDAGQNSGSAYLFDVDRQSPTFGLELFKLTASDASAHARFGSSVAISGNMAIVGATLADDACPGDSLFPLCPSGSAYVFDVTTGEELFKLTASDAAAGDQFGNSVGISDGVAVVGAWRSDDAGGESGSAYLFDLTTGEEFLKLTASDAEADDTFGFSVGISGQSAIVGAYADDDLGNGSGSAYLYYLIPEPSSFLLAALALIGLLGFARRRRVVIP